VAAARLTEAPPSTGEPAASPAAGAHARLRAPIHAAGRLAHRAAIMRTFLAVEGLPAAATRAWFARGLRDCEQGLFSTLRCGSDKQLIF
jgi:hypothetical protein